MTGWGAVAPVVVVLALTGCSSDETTASTSSVTATPTSVATLVPIVGVFEAVQFWPACLQGVLEHQGITWYTLASVRSEAWNPDLAARLAEVLAVAREAPPGGGTSGLRRVTPPGPGDDIGTLVVWADGVARWTSDSGDLDVWLVDDELVYTWVC